MTSSGFPPGDPADYALVMPFVACVSRGGPYDDQAFAAGYHAGLLDKSLEIAATVCATDLDAVVRTALLPQLDLLAMRYGYRLANYGETPDAPGWSSITFTTRPEEAT